MKRDILIFILGGIFFSCISVYATISYQASQINYNNTTLDLALDNLYTTQNSTVSNLTNQNTILQGQYDSLQSDYNNLLSEKNNILSRGFTFGTLNKNGSYGDQGSNRTASITLDKGKYIVTAFRGRSWVINTTVSTTRNDNILAISCSKTCTNVAIMGHEFLGIPSQASRDIYPRLQAYLGVRYIEILSDQTVVSANWALDDNSTAIEDVEIMAKSVSK